jgi:hypothetical protein
LAAAAALVLLAGLGAIVAVALAASEVDRPDVSTETPPVETTAPGPTVTTEAPVVTVPAVPTTAPPDGSVTPPGLPRDGLSTAGIGPLRFGATIAEAEELTGMKAVVSDGCGDGRLATMGVDGLGVLFLDGRFFAWSLATTGWSTPSGVAVGASATDVLALVPGLERLDRPEASYLYLPPEPTDLLLLLGPGDTVLSMAASDGPQLFPASDFC